jgi:ABC-type transporter Mla MlaB component
MHRAFRIKTQKKDDTLIVKLIGDVDGSSASEVAAHIEHVQSRYQRIVIDASRMGKVHPFGQAVLERIPWCLMSDAV